MTLKQLQAEIKRATKEKAYWEKKRDESIQEGSPAHIVAYDEKWIAHYEALLAKYEEQLPAAIEKEMAKEAKKAEREATKQKADEMIYYQHGCYFYGETPNGKRWNAAPNFYALTDRGLHCYTMTIEGMGTVFTSGTLSHVLETAAKN